MNRDTFTAADAERAVRDLQRDPAAVGYGAYLRRKGLIGHPPPAERMKILARLVELFQRAPDAPAAEPPTVICTGRVLSQGCGR